MNTTASSNPDSTCEIERVEDGADHKTYLCNKDARHVWQPTPKVQIYVCRECKRWLETLESLGQPLV